MPHLSLVLIGFGNVGKALARLLLRKQEDLKAQYGITFQVTGIATSRHGTSLDPNGIDLQRALARIETGQPLATLSSFGAPASMTDFICACSHAAGKNADLEVLFENTPVNHLTGQPAIDHLRAALECGMHAVTANKGPVVHGFAQLNELALQKQRRFMYESAVMDGAPIFSLFRGPLPCAELRGFHGILNSCTNYILGLMENGESFEQAVSSAQAIGIAETDPSADIDGWDAAIKVSALSTALMGIPLKPQEVTREGISAITPQMLSEAQQAGERWKLVCTCRRLEDGLQAAVAPRRVPPGSPLYSINGTSSYVQFELDVLPGLGIVESNPGPETTAYGLLADMINIVRGM